MINRLVKVVALVGCFCIITSVNAKTFDMQEFDLNNGMKVIVVPNHKAPIIKHMVWYKVGSMDEVLGKSGKAHLLEHLMFRGTKRVKDSEFSRIIDENGGDSNAFTSFDYTAYHQTLDITRLELAMFLESDRMKNLQISQQAFEKERDIVFQERKQVVENNPAGYFRETFSSMLWGGHPYGRPVIGSNEEIMSFKLEDVVNFYNAFYTPQNAILVLSGDIDVETAKILADKYYGKIKPHEMAERVETPLIDKPYSSELRMSLPNINFSRISKSYISDSYNTDKHKMYALMVLSKYMGEGETSKLYKDLVVNKKAALGVSSSYNGFTRSYGTFSISMIPSSEKDLTKSIQQLEISIKNALLSLNPKEIEVAKQKMLAGLVYVRDNPNDAAYIVGAMASIGVPVAEIDDYEENIKSVSFEDVRDIAQDLFSNAQNLTGILTPEGVNKND